MALVLKEKAGINFQKQNHGSDHDSWVETESRLFSWLRKLGLWCSILIVADRFMFFNCSVR